MMKDYFDSYKIEKILNKETVITEILNKTTDLIVKF